MTWKALHTLSQDALHHARPLQPPRTMDPTGTSTASTGGRLAASPQSASAIAKTATGAQIARLPTPARPPQPPQTMDPTGTSTASTGGKLAGRLAHVLARAATLITWETTAKLHLLQRMLPPSRQRQRPPPLQLQLQRKLPQLLRHPRQQRPLAPPTLVETTQSASTSTTESMTSFVTVKMGLVGEASS